MLQAAIYHRVSTADQDVTLARDELRSACRARGYEIAMEVEETCSGRLAERPGLSKVLDAVSRGHINVVVVWKIDRFGRSTIDLLNKIRAINSAGARFVVVTQGLDIGAQGDAISSLILTVLAGVAEFERTMIVERTRMGLKKAKDSGKKLGRRVDRHRPKPEVVLSLRQEGLSWAEVGQRLDCHPSAARRAAIAC